MDDYNLFTNRQLKGFILEEAMPATPAVSCTANFIFLIIRLK